MLKFENGKNYNSLNITMSKNGIPVAINDLSPHDPDLTFGFVLQYDDKSIQGVGNFGNDAIWIPLGEKGIKIIRNNPTYHSLQETCINMEVIGDLNLPILPQLFWCEISSCENQEYIVSCYENVESKPSPRVEEDNSYLPTEDINTVKDFLQGNTETNKQCAELFYVHKLVPEDEWYKKQNFIGNKIIDCHRFRIIPERYHFNSNGKSPEELEAIYKNMVKRYLSIRDDMGLPKWKGRIYQGFVFDNNSVFHGYSSSNRIYDSYEKLPFIPFNKVFGKKVLDLGSNQGFFSFQASMAGAQEVTGLEITQPDLDAANDIKEILQLDNVNFLNTDAVKFLEETEEKYELIIANSVIHQIYNNLQGADSMLKNIANKCNYFVFESPVNHTTMTISLSEIIQKLEEHFSTVRLLHIYNAYSSGYRANFVCYP